MSSESPAPDSAVVERFAGSHGPVLGWLVVTVGLAVAVGAAWNLTRSTDAVVALGLVLAALGWGSMIHPRIWVTRDDLVLRGMVTSTHIPLAGIESYAVRQYLAVHAGDKKYVSSVLGHKRRSNLSRMSLFRRVEPDPVEQNYHEMDPVEYFEDRLGTYTDQARVRAGVKVASPAQLELGRTVRRTVDLVPALVVGIPPVLFGLALVIN